MTAPTATGPNGTPSRRPWRFARTCTTMHGESWKSTSKPTSIRHLDTPVQNPRAGSDQYGGELITQLFGDDPGRDRVRWRDLSAAGCGHSESDHAASEPIRLAVGPPEGP